MATESVQVSLFESGHLGAGDSRKIRDFRYHRIHGSVDLRWPGQMRLGLAVETIATPQHDLTPVFATEWTPSGSTPTVYYLVGKTVQRIRNGSVIAIGGASPNVFSSNATGGMFDDDGNGVPYLYVCFGGKSTDNSISRMDVNETVTTATSLVADLLLTLNGKAYRTLTPSGGNANCQVSVVPYGSDRFEAANWGTPQTVGFAI